MSNEAQEPVTSVTPNVEQKKRTQFELDLEVSNTSFEKRKAIFVQLASEITALSLKMQVLEKLGKPLAKLEPLIKKIRDKLIELEEVNLETLQALPDKTSFSEMKTRTLLLFRDQVRLTTAMNSLRPLFIKLATAEIKLNEDGTDLKKFLNEKIEEFQTRLPRAVADIEILFNRYFKFFDTPFEEAIQGINNLGDTESIQLELNHYGDEGILRNLMEILPNRKDDINKIIASRKQIMAALDVRSRQLAKQPNET